MQRSTSWRAALLILCVLSASLLAQRGATLSLTYYDMLFLSEPALHGELKLSADQVKKVTAFRDKWFNESTIGRTLEADSKEVKAAEKFLAETLDAGQRTRLRQVVLQQRARRATRSFPDSTFADLKLTQQQIQRWRDGEDLATLLTEQQQPLWRKLTGEKFEPTLRPTVARGGFPRTPRSEQMMLLANAGTRKELGLSQGQLEKLEEAQAAWTAALRDYRSLNRQEQQALRDKAQKAFDKALAELLEEKQRLRLEQIELQQLVREQGELSLFHDARVVKKLGLSEEQKKQRDAVLEQRAGELAQLFAAGGDSGELAGKTRAFREATREKLLGVLTGKQREQMKSLLGAPYTPQRGLVGAGGGGAAPFTTDILQAEMYFLTAPELREQLNLTGEEVKKVAELRDRFMQATRELFTLDDRDAKRKELIEKTGKELTDLLGGKRRERFGQLVLQSLERGGDSFLFRFLAVWNISQVATKLRLSDEQKSRLGSGETLDKVLSAEQQKTWQQMKGAPSKVALTVQSPVPAGGRFTTRPLVPPVKVRYLQEEEVQKELGLSKEQVTGVAGLVQKWREETADAAKWTAQERATKMPKATEAVEGAMAKLLDAAQAKRFQQILLHNVRVLDRGFARGGPGGKQELVATLAIPGSFAFMDGEVGLGAVLLYPAAGKQLGLSDEQRQKVEKIVRNAQRVPDLINTEMSAHRAKREVVSKVVANFRVLTDRQFEEVLTEGQKKELKEMLGKPFKLTQPRFAPGRFGD